MTTNNTLGDTFGPLAVYAGGILAIMILGTFYALLGIALITLSVFSKTERKPPALP